MFCQNKNIFSFWTCKKSRDKIDDWEKRISTWNRKRDTLASVCLLSNQFILWKIILFMESRQTQHSVFSIYTCSQLLRNKKWWKRTISQIFLMISLKIRRMNWFEPISERLSIFSWMHEKTMSRPPSNLEF